MIPARQLPAVELVAQDTLTDEQIAAQLGIKRITLARWKRGAEFQAAVREAAEAIAAAIRAQGIANRENRLRAANERHELMQQVIAARAKANTWRARADMRDEHFDLETYTAAGAETGLMVHTVTYLKDGRREEWAVDTGLLKAMLDHEKQAAIETGQWTEKRELTGKDGGAIVVRTMTAEIPKGVQQPGGNEGAAAAVGRTD